nr:hypothetical protein [Angustibacter aerolatus]
MLEPARGARRGLRADRAVRVGLEPDLGPGDGADEPHRPAAATHPDGHAVVRRGHGRARCLDRPARQRDRDRRRRPHAGVRARLPRVRAGQARCRA